MKLLMPDLHHIPHPELLRLCEHPCQQIAELAQCEFYFRQAERTQAMERTAAFEDFGPYLAQRRN